MKIMKHFFLLLFLILPASAFAQRTIVDTTNYVFNYAVKYTTDEEFKPFDDEVVVEIGSHRTLCYGYWDEANTLAIDSIRSHGGSIADYLALGNPIGSFTYHILKNYPKNGFLTVTKYEGKNYLYTEPMIEKKWNLEEGDTTILGYDCKKATCTFRNRTWTVWYTLDIPISEGPWKLDGLPGMILSAIDKKRQYSFDCIGIKKNVNRPMTMLMNKFIKTTGTYLERIYKLKEKNYEAYRKATGADRNVLSYPEYTPRTACFLEYYEPNKK